MNIICVKQPKILKSMYFKPIIDDSQYLQDFRRFFWTCSSDLMLFKAFTMILIFSNYFS